MQQQRLMVCTSGRETASDRELLVEQLIQSDEVTLIGVTHHLLPDALVQALERRGIFWRKIQIVYPNRNNMQRLIDQGQMPSERLIEWEESKQRVQIFLARNAPHLPYREGCLECNQDLSFIGARYMHNGQGYIRFAPLLLASDPRSTTKLDMSSDVVLFTQISHAIDATVLCSIPLDYWALVGQYDHGVFRYGGMITNPINIRTARLAGITFPVVLVVLYFETLTGICTLLQERTIYNSASDAGTYCNITGRLYTDDVVSPYPGRFFIDSTIDDFVATNMFNQFSGLFKGNVLDDIVWQRGAVRVVHERLGLDVDPGRLEKRSSCYFANKSGDLFFQIFSLKLGRDSKVDEWELIQQRRHHAALKPCRMSELKQLHSETKLNHMFQSRFTDLFLPLFEQIQIAP